MRLSTKSRYAITAMLNLSLNANAGPVTLADISEDQSVSLSYLEQLFAALRAKGLVRGVRGPGGGYYLGRQADEISIADVICAVDEWVDYTRSQPQRNGIDIEPKTTRAMWDDLSTQLFDFLDRISLSDLAKRGGAAPAAQALIGRDAAALLRMRHQAA